MEIDGRDFVPFLLGTRSLSGALLERSCLADTRFLEVLDEENAAFFRLLNAGNARAFGAAAMPAWVQLDCATLPTATIGFALARDAVPEALAASLGVGPDDALVPVAEYCAAWTAEPGTVVGFSMFSLLPGLRLGVRSKALALLSMGARRQVGVTRAAGPERRAQEVFGALSVLAESPSVHPDPDTIVYEVDVPPREVLERIVRTGA